MHLLYNNIPLVRAQRLAAHLRQSGIMAGVITSHGTWGLIHYELVILHPSLREQADTLCREVLAAGKADDADDAGDKLTDEMLALSAEPDLSLLKEDLKLSCPACGSKFSAQAGAVERGVGAADDQMGACPACKQPLDIAQLVAEQHGPDALMDCYPGPSDEDLLKHAGTIPCPACGYSLDGLAQSGNCPECGTPYDKAAIVRAFMERLMGW